MTTLTHTTPKATDVPQDQDPRQVREKADLTEASMADLMGMSLNGYTLWEKGARQPGGPAFQLLRLLDNDPKGVIAALR